EKIAEHAGRRIKGLGDGVMVSFGSTRHAVECALDIQRAITDYSKANPNRRLRIRIGINTGEVVEEAGDIFGAAVNMAARVAGKAKGGQVLVSEVVRQLVGPITEISFTYRGHYKLKGFPDRWRLHEAVPGEQPAAIAPTVTPGDGFVGREQEKLDIRLVLDRASTGTGGMVLLSGAPGIGTSRLALEISTGAPRKGWILPAGRCAEPEGGPQPRVGGVGAGALAPAPRRRRRGLAAPPGALPAERFPPRGPRFRGTPPGSDLPAGPRRESLFKAVFDLLVAAQGAKPMLV